MKDEIIHANVAIKFNQVVNWVNFIQQGGINILSERNNFRHFHKLE